MTRSNERLEMFSDGVFAIAVTLLILDLKVPVLESVHSNKDVWQDLGRKWPAFFALALSFLIIFISWIGHHNLLLLLDKTSPRFQFANGFFLLTVIFIPYPTAFMAEYLNTPYAQPAIVFYCLSSIFHNVGWIVLHRYILKPKSLLKDSVDPAYVKQIAKGSNYGFFIYLALAIMAWWLPYIAIMLSVLIWIYWIYLSVSIKKFL